MKKFLLTLAFAVAGNAYAAPTFPIAVDDRSAVFAMVEDIITKQEVRSWEVLSFEKEDMTCESAERTLKCDGYFMLEDNEDHGWPRNGEFEIVFSVTDGKATEVMSSKIYSYL